MLLNMLSATLDQQGQQQLDVELQKPMWSSRPAHIRQDVAAMVSSLSLYNIRPTFTKDNHHTLKTVSACVQLVYS